MRALTFLLFLAPTLLWGQICNEPSPVSYTGFGAQQTESDYFAGSDFLDGLNNSSYWSLGSGISDNNLAIWSNADVHTFLGVKARNTTAPNDNVSADGNTYLVEPGYSLASQNGSVGTGPESNWNILMYAGLDAGAFDSVDVIMHIDFDPCFDYTLEDMYSINIGSAFDGNPLTSASSFSSFGINTNMGSSEIAALNPAGTGFDATVEGYYTFAIQVLDNCGNQKLWNEITVYVQSTTTELGNAVADANGNNVYDDNEAMGCTNAAACNYDCAATTNEGCEYTSCSDCTVENACNYNSEAPIGNSESCDYPFDLYGASHFDCAGVCLNDADGDGVCDEDEVVGCKDVTACNYDDTNTTDADNELCTYAESNADCNGDCLTGFTEVDGSCVPIVEGCTESGACNYGGSSTNTNDGSCEFTSCGACLNANACNYNIGSGLIHNASLCVFATQSCDSCSGETNGTGTVVDGDTDNDGICNNAEITGCQDNTSCNYDSTATDAGTCQFDDAIGACGGSCAADIDGDGICDSIDLCVDADACNYDILNAECEYLPCEGCTVDSACNYDEYATVSTPTCLYPVNCDSCSGVTDGTGTVVSGDANINGICDDNEVAGCTDNSAPNFDPLATEDDDSCNASIDGCYLPFDCNYNPNYTNAVLSMCSPAVGGDTPCSGGMMGNPPPITTCDNTYACNYGDEGPCDFVSCVGCMNTAGCDYDVDNIYSATCDYSCYGCTNADADNYDATSTIDDNSCVISGCTTFGACNYDSTANNDDASCEVTSCVGCNAIDACNYDASVTLNEPISCVYVEDSCDSCSGATDGTGLVVDGDADNDGTCDGDEVDGCTDVNACNYNTAATDDDSSCLYSDACGDCGGTGVDTDNDGTCDAEEILGCTNSIACNYDSAATENTGCDFTSCEGCIDPVACNYDDEATTSVPSSCQYPTDLYGADHFDCDGVCLNDTDEDGTCDEDEVPGCMDSNACNYSASATDMDESCIYPASEYVDCYGACLIDDDEDGVCDQEEVYGCTVTLACNYALGSTENDGSCEFSSCAGCTIESACNYDATATLSNNITCTYIPAGWDDCDQTICTDSDNDGNCDFDEVAGCVGEFGAPHILMTGMLELATPVADWAANDYTTSTSDATGVEGITWVDYAGRLNDGRYSVTRIYTATDVCGNSGEAGQLLIANDSSAAGCTNASATNYDAAAVNDNGLCDYSPACLGDLNLDNIIGTSDLLILLSSFGLPCPE